MVVVNITVNATRNSMCLFSFGRIIILYRIASHCIVSHRIASHDMLLGRDRYWLDRSRVIPAPIEQSW